MLIHARANDKETGSELIYNRGILHIDKQNRNTYSYEIFLENYKLLFDITFEL